jgi:tetratricopeptide (TPR) repeat protein
MKVLIKRVVIALSFVAGAVGGVIIGSHPVSGVVLLIGGLIGTVYSFWSSETRQDESDLMQGTMAELFIASGAGNSYTKLVYRKLSRGGVQYVISDLERALELDPRDADALALYVKIGVLQLWLRTVSDIRSRPPAYSDPDRLRQMIQRGFDTGERPADFFCAMGGLLDASKRCAEARECFRRGSELDPNPYWRLFSCMSYGIEGKYDEALAEIEFGISEGAKGPLTDFYYGRCLASVGEFSRATALFKKVKRYRGLSYHLALAMQEAYYFSWRPFLSAYYEIRAALMMARFNPRKATRHLTVAATHCLTPMFVRAAQIIARLSKLIPLLRDSIVAKACELDEPYFSLGNSLAAKAKYAAAKKLFALAAERAPLARNCLNLCTAAILTGDWELAESACLRALAISPGNALATQYLHRIRHKDSSAGHVLHLQVDLTP